MASVPLSKKLSNSRYNNWVKASLAVLITKEGIEPFVEDEIEQFQQKCLTDICNNQGLPCGTICTNCCTENLVKCPTNKICNVKHMKCSYHKDSATTFLFAGCPNNICHNFKTEIQKAHRYNGPSYKNTDATQWCSKSWEVAKCFMPRDGYKDVVSASETDFNGINSVIINCRCFETKVTDDLSKKGNIFDKGRDIGKAVRHTPILEVVDKDLKQYFIDLDNLLSDTGHNNAKFKARKRLSELQNDSLLIGKDDVRKVLDDVAKVAQGNIKILSDEFKKEEEKSKLELIETTQKSLEILENKENITLAEIDKVLKSAIDELEKQTKVSHKRINSETDKGVDKIKTETKIGVSLIHEATDEGTCKIRKESEAAKDQVKQAANEELQKVSAANKQKEEEEYIAAKKNIDIRMAHQCQLKKENYRQWVKAGLGLGYLKEGLVPFCNDIADQQHKELLQNLQYTKSLPSTVTCGSCRVETLKPDHKPVPGNAGNKVCPLGQEKCSCCCKGKIACPNNICGAIYDYIVQHHSSSPPAPNWKNTDAQQWLTDPWSICQCFINAPGYEQKQSAGETDCTGLLHLMINNQYFHSHIGCNVTGTNNLFSKVRQYRNNIFQSCSMELEESEANTYLDDMMAVLQDGKELLQRSDAQIAVKKLQDLKKKDFTTEGFEEILRQIKEEIVKMLKVLKSTENAATQENYDDLKKKLIELETKMSDKKKGKLENEKELKKTITDPKKKLLDFESKMSEENDKKLENAELKKKLGVFETHVSEQKEGDQDVRQSYLLNNTECEINVPVLPFNRRQGELQDTAARGPTSGAIGGVLQAGGPPSGETLCKPAMLPKLKDELITWYNTNQSTVYLCPLTDSYPTHLAGFYIMPEIDQQMNVLGGRKVTTRVMSLQDLFTSVKRVPREIYLSAAAGFGKTAFSKYLAITWCQAHKKDENYKHFKEEELEALSGFEFLFLVLLRDSSKECDIDNMIEQQIINNLPCSSSMPKGLLKDILRDEKCLVILDGLDEWTHPDNDCTRLSKSIPHRYAREKCIILTTTPPWKLGVSNLKTSQIDKTVELVKLNENNSRQFKYNAMKMLNMNLQDGRLKNEVCRFEEAIYDHDLEDMEYSPLLLLYLICLWVEKMPIGNSAVDLYTGIIQLLLSRTEKIHGKFHSSCEISPSNVPECFRKHQHFCSYYTFLVTIGKLAFYTLFSKKKEHALVFDENVAEKYLNQEDLKSSCLSGILSESKVKTLINESSKISFSHKTVQEYFSAIFISFQNTSEFQKIIFEEFNCLQNILDISKVFVFISGMNPKLMSTISNDLMLVINNDEKTSKYRTMTDNDDMYIKPLQDLQDMYISCSKESQENRDLKLCLQDVFINEKYQQENYFKQLQHQCQQNKENIKSIMIENEGICSLQEIISLFTLSDLPHIEKLYYRGEIVEEEIMSLLLDPLKCLAVISHKWENHQFVGERCQLSAEINGRLVKLQHLECLYIDCFTMTHEVMETLLNFLTSKKSMKEITLYSLYCSDHDTSCRGFNLDLSQHSQLRRSGLLQIPVSQLNMDVSLLEDCAVGKLYKPGVVSSYLSQLSAASKLQTFMCSDLESSSDIETMLQTLSLLYHVKDVRLYYINLGKRSLTLSPQMINIECVDLLYITMSCSVLHDLITVINKLPHTVTVQLYGCDIKPETDFENFKTLIKQSDNFVVTYDDTLVSGICRFVFKTTTSTE